MIEDKWNIQDSFRKSVLHQPLDGLLYDLDLMPEQIKYGRDYALYQSIIILRKEVEELEERLSSVYVGIDFV